MRKIQELKVNHARTQDELTSVVNEKDQIENDNQTLDQENTVNCVEKNH